MKKLFLFIFLATFLLLSFNQVQAAGLVPCGGEGELACRFCDFFVMIERIVDFFLFKLVPPIAIFMIVIGGVMFFFASGNQALLATAKKTLTSVVIGLLIIYSAWMLIGLFLSVIGVANTSFGDAIKDWFNINCI